jgi:uncharacterized membrane protein HdeD (DUF308 family)
MVETILVRGSPPVPDVRDPSAADQGERAMTIADRDLNQFEGNIRETIRSHATLFLVQGIIMTLLGILAVAEPMIATLAVELFAGWLFLISGIVGLVGLFRARQMPGFWWLLLTAALSVLAGAYLIWRPLAGILSLTLVIAAFFAAQGIVQIVTAIAHRGLLRSWSSLLIVGIVNLILAAIIISGFPGTAAWTLGVLFGANLIMWGVALIITATACRKLTAAPAKSRPA